MDIKYGRKRSGIVKELITKTNEWIDSIDDESVKEAATKDTIITGGSIASMLLGESVNDFDIYFRTKETTKLIANYYVSKFNQKNDLEVGSAVNPYKPEVQEKIKTNAKGEYEERIIIYMKSAGIAGEDQTTYEYFESQPDYATEEFVESTKPKKGDPYRVVFLSENAITLSDKIQLITRFYGQPDKIHDNYDFIHATCYWDHGKQALVLPADAMESMLSRTLTYKGSLYPIASIFRMKKFIERGWRISAGQQLKIMWQISELNLQDYDVIQEQLTGVDQAYLYQLIRALKGVDPEKINSTYVGAIIDRIFN